MTKTTEEDMKDFSIKFMQCYKKVVENCNQTFLIDFQIWHYVLTHFSNEQIINFLPNFIIDAFENTEACVDFYYDIIVTNFKETIIEELEEAISTLMTTHSVSQGEAMIAADSAFEKQIGYFTVFINSIIMSYIALGELVQEGAI